MSLVKRVSVDYTSTVLLFTEKPIDGLEFVYNDNFLELGS